MLPTNTHILFPEFEYLAPTTAYEVTALLAEYGEDARVIAGGTDLLVQMKMERRQPAHVISLARVNTLQGIHENSTLTIGATTSIRTLYQSLGANQQSLVSSIEAVPSSLLPLPSSAFSALAEACNWFSTVQIMYMATLGGNLCNGSPAADTAPCLLAFDAEVNLKSKTGDRVLPLTEFFLAPGKTALQPDELLTAVLVPTLPENTGSAFIKVSRVLADISQVCTAVRLTRSGDTITDARIALGSVAPTPIRVNQAEQSLVGEPFSAALAQHVGEIAAAEIRPISDVRATREYRQSVAAVIVRDALLKAWERAL